jgi:hypothetical protein
MLTWGITWTLPIFSLYEQSFASSFGVHSPVQIASGFHDTRRYDVFLYTTMVKVLLSLSQSVPHLRGFVNPDFEQH